MRGLALEGGGAKGAFHCGAVKALRESGYEFDGVVGASIGAVNGALICQDGGGHETLCEVWENVRTEDFTHYDNVMVNNLINGVRSYESFKYWMKQLGSFLRHFRVPVDNFREFVFRIVDEKKIRASRLDFGLTTYCRTDKKLLEPFKEDIPDGMLAEYVLASAYFPLFVPEPIRGKQYIDGGWKNNLPWNMFKARPGYDEAIVVRTMSDMPFPPFECDSALKIRCICPSEDLGNTIQIWNDSVRYKMRLGYYDAMRFVKGYGGRRFYFDSSLEPFETIFRALGGAAKQEIARSARSRRDVAEICATDYFEDIGRELRLEKFRVYSPIEFLKELASASNASRASDSGPGEAKFRSDRKLELFRKRVAPKIRDLTL